jgi:hypothetical protein
LGNDLVALRVAIDNLVRDANYVNAMGGAAFFEAAPFNLPTADATALAGAIGAVTSTNPTVTAINTFLNANVALTGGL